MGPRPSARNSMTRNGPEAPAPRGPRAHLEALAWSFSCRRMARWARTSRRARASLLCCSSRVQRGAIHPCTPPQTGAGVPSPLPPRPVSAPLACAAAEVVRVPDPVLPVAGSQPTPKAEPIPSSRRPRVISASMTRSPAVEAGPPRSVWLQVQCQNHQLGGRGPLLDPTTVEQVAELAPQPRQPPLREPLETL